MRSTSPGARFAFLVAGISLLVTVSTGAEWVGEPLRAVHLVTLVGLGVATGVSWMQAVIMYRESR